MLVLVEFGTDLSTAIDIASAWGLKQRSQVVVPNLTLPVAEHSGPENMAGVVGALPWDWKVPYVYDFPRGKQFVETFASRYHRYPGTAAASAYTILHEYRAAVERAKSFESAPVIRALEGHAYTLLKDRQLWRDFDHQSVQTVYAVRCNPPSVVRSDRFKLDYFDIVDTLAGEDAAQTRAEWEAARRRAGKPLTLEKLAGEP